MDDNENKTDVQPQGITAMATDGNAEQGVKISGIAYSGNEILQVDRTTGKPYRLVVDLEGMEFAKQIPLMDSHTNALWSKLGEVTPVIAEGKLAFTGRILFANYIAEMGRMSKWQVSIGAQPTEKKTVAAGQKVTVNGMEFTGPITVATKSVLREISVVAIGADKDTEMTIAASLKMDDGVNTITTGDTAMNGTDTAANAAQAPLNAAPTGIDVQAQAPAASVQIDGEQMKQVAANAVKEERQRVAEINTICGTDCGDIAAQAIKEGWDIPTVTAKCLEAIRKNRPHTGPNVVIPTQAAMTAEVLECALALRCGIQPEDLKGHSEQTIEAGTKAMAISLKELCLEAIRLNGGYASSVGFDNETIRAAFSTVSLPGILGNVANKLTLRAFNNTPVLAFNFCTTGNLNDFKESDRFRLTDVGDLQPVAADGEIKEGGVTEESAKNQLDTYGKKFCLTRKMIINDDLGVFMQVPKAMGNRAARLIDKLFFERLTANPTWNDGKALFHADHHNLIPSGGELSEATLKKAIELFLNQTDSDDQPINLEPQTILVPTAYKFTAEALVSSLSLVAAGSTDRIIPTMNVLARQGLKVVSTNYIKGKDWYLFANPAECDTFEIGYLKGKRTPTVEQGETDFNTLGMWFRVYFDLGIREQDYRGFTKAAQA